MWFCLSLLGVVCCLATWLARDRRSSLELSEIVLYFLNEKLRHGNDTVALFRFGSSDNITSVQTLIGLIDTHRTFLEIEVCRGECQQLALTDTAPVTAFTETIYRLISICNSWLDITNEEFILDPDHYWIG